MSKETFERKLKGEVVYVYKVKNPKYLEYIDSLNIEIPEYIWKESSEVELIEHLEDTHKILK